MKTTTPISGLGGRHRRGQSITVDFIISISIFLLLLAICYSVWARDTIRLDDSLTQARAEEAARRGLSALVESPGFPSNWAALNMGPDNSSLLGIGIASSPGQIDDFKMKRLSTLFSSGTTYNLTTLKMGLEPFQSDVLIAYLNGTTVASMGTAPAGPKNVVLATASRLAYYNGNYVLARVRVWQVIPT